jgi:demethylspheroidene O-methyltransferase
MSASQRLVSGEVLDAYPVERHKCLLDVGGGEGVFLVTAAARAPQLRLMLFDLPAVAERARARFAAEGLADRARAVGGDFFADPLPGGADIISLVRVVHDHDDASALALLRAARRALPDDGTLLLAEPMSGTPGAEPIGDAYFGFYLLAMGSGRPRTPAELEALLRSAGFGRIRRISTRMPLQTCLMVAEPGRV